MRRLGFSDATTFLQSTVSFQRKTRMLVRVGSADLGSSNIFNTSFCHDNGLAIGLDRSFESVVQQRQRIDGLPEE